MVTQEANELLIRLCKSYTFLQRLNEDIQSRPFSTRIHGQFDHELKKSQNIISKLSSLLRRYHSFEFSSTLSLEINSDDNESNKSDEISKEDEDEYKDEEGENDEKSTVERRFYQLRFCQKLQFYQV